jgi:hypothetical protein
MHYMVRSRVYSQMIIIKNKLRSSTTDNRLKLLHVSIHSIYHVMSFADSHLMTSLMTLQQKNCESVICKVVTVSTLAKLMNVR